MELETFLNLPTSEVAQIVRSQGPKVCVFPINGTRRWFLMEHAARVQGDPIAAYMDISSQNHVDLYRLFFDHGIDTLITPEFGSDLFRRGDEYVRRIGADGLARLASHPMFLNFYMEYGVRVHFYGEYRRYLTETPYVYLIDLFAEASTKTCHNDRHRLFIGVFGEDATQTISEYSIEYFQTYGKSPQKQHLIEKFYGEMIKPVDLFIGFDKFSAFDYPLLDDGEVDLYFSIAPSPYMSARLLRSILYDHLYTRRAVELDYQEMPQEDFIWLREFYTQNAGVALGVGTLKSGIWLPDVKLSIPR